MNEPGILFLDDEQNVLNALRRVFQDEDYPMIFTTSPEEALKRIVGNGISVVVSDYRMPAMTGIEFLEKVKRASPETVRLLLTGHADIKIALEAINLGAVFRFLTKPWDDEELLHAVRQAAAHNALVIENRRLNDLTLIQNHQLRDLNENLEIKVKERTREVEDLNRHLETSFLGSVRVMAGLAEVHSKVIGSHSRRVASISKGMAAKMGLDRNEIRQVEVAALLHDVGKMAISRETLGKEEHALSTGEKEMLKRHPVMGETIVRMVPNMENASRLVRHHHEYFNGSGLPDGLKGEKIPMGSRIIAVADAYDNALNILSAYQSNSPVKAFQKVGGLAKSELDPKAIDALGAVLLEMGSLGLDPGEVEIDFHELRVGMTISREIRNARGLLLLPAKTAVTVEIVKTLLDYPTSERGQEGIHIFRVPQSPT